MTARRIPGPTDRVVIVGAGLGGLACALHLAGAGREVVLLERGSRPGGRAGRLEIGGYAFDSGPTVLTMPELLAEAFAAVGEDMAAWVSLTRLDPAYRAWFADGSHLDVIADVEAMSDEVARVCGPGEAHGYRRYVDYAREMWRRQRADFIDRNFDRPTDLLSTNLWWLAAHGAFGNLDARVGHYLRDERTRRIFSFQAMYAGLAPHRARALYCVISYLDAVTGVYYPRGGIHAVPTAMAAAAERHGVQIRYDVEVTGVTVTAGRATGVRTADGEHIPADVVVLNADLPAADRLIPTPVRRRRPRYSPSCVLVHLGASRGYPHTAHHNIHFGTAWRATFDEVIRQGRLMSDPSLLVTHPSRSDPTLAPPGRHTYYVLAPAPNLTAGPLPWRSGLAASYADALVATLCRRGYPGIGDAVEVRHVVTPADWADVGLAAGTPFAAAHSLTQTGPFRPGNVHPKVANVVYAGCGTRPGVGIPMVVISGKLAAARITSPARGRP